MHATGIRTPMAEHLQRGGDRCARHDGKRSGHAMNKLVPIAGIAGWIVFGDWLAGLALGILALTWVLLPAEEGPPVLALAVTLQWVSVTIGLFYNLLTGRPLDAIIRADYRYMVV